MAALDWYVTALCLAAGVGIAGFWLAALATGFADDVGEFDVSKPWHIAAELVAGALLLAGGIARLIDHRAVWSTVLAAGGLGGLVYAVLQSPGYYLRKTPAVAWLLGLTGLAAIPAFVILARG